MTPELRAYYEKSRKSIAFVEMIRNSLCSQREAAKILQTSRRTLRDWSKNGSKCWSKCSSEESKDFF